VLNKIDRLDPLQAAVLEKAFKGILISALNRRTFSDLLGEMERLIWRESGGNSDELQSTSTQKSAS
jgi:50S ribosomal subunit-associated GTPase HflX